MWCAWDVGEGVKFVVKGREKFIYGSTVGGHRFFVDIRKMPRVNR